MAYVPPPNLVTVHGFPRYDPLLGMRKVSNVFNPDVSTNAGKEYIAGVASLFGAYVAMAVLLFVGFGIVFALACFRRKKCCPPRDKKRRKRGCISVCCGLVFSPRLWFLLAVCSMLGGCFFAFSVLTKLSGGVTSTVQGLQSFNNVLSNANNKVNTELVPPIEDATSSAQGLVTALTNAGAPADLVSAVDPVISATQGLSTQLLLVTSLLSQATSALGDAVGGKGLLPISQAGPMLFRSGLGVLIGFVVYLVGSLIGLVGKPFGAKALRGSLPILLVTIGGVWAFGAVFFAVVLAGSDICVTPSAAILSILNATHAPDTAYQTAFFYTAPCGNNTPVGAYAQLLEGQRQARDSLAELDALNATIFNYTSQDPFKGPEIAAAAAPYLNQLSFDMNETSDGISVTLGAVSCPVVNAVFIQVIDGLCGGLIDNAFIVWGFATSAGILLVVLAIAASSLACRHPGDDDAAEHTALVDEAETYLDMTYGAHPSAAARKQQPVGRGGGAYQYTAVAGGAAGQKRGVENGYY